MRSDLVRLGRTRRALHLPVAVSPSVTPRLTAERARRAAGAGLRSPRSASTARARQPRGAPRRRRAFRGDARAIRLLRAAGLHRAGEHASSCARTSRSWRRWPRSSRAGATIWEVFFLVHVGRGDRRSTSSRRRRTRTSATSSSMRPVTASSCAPSRRRSSAGSSPGGGASDPEPLRHRRAVRAAGDRPAQARSASRRGRSKAQTKGTRDGKGIVFVAHDGDVYPAGFLPLALGNVRDASLVEIYRDHPLLRDIRAARFRGRCGTCEYTDLCGGSRARAYAASGDPLGEDPACAYLQALP